MIEGYYRYIVVSRKFVRRTIRVDTTNRKIVDVSEKFTVVVMSFACRSYPSSSRRVLGGFRTMLDGQNPVY